MYFFSLLKKGGVHLSGRKIIPREEFSDLVSAKELIDYAKEEAAFIIEEAKKEGEHIRARNKEEGFQEGLTLFNQKVIAFDETVKVLRHEMQRAILPLVLKAVKKIVGDTLELDPEAIVNVVIQAIKSVSNTHRVKIFVNRHDLHYVEKEKEKIKLEFERLEAFHIEERADVPRGGCIIETESGILNATLENQYRALERALESHRTR